MFQAVRRASIRQAGVHRGPQKTGLGRPESWALPKRHAPVVSPQNAILSSLSVPQQPHGDTHNATVNPDTTGLNAQSMWQRQSSVLSGHYPTSFESIADATAVNPYQPPSVDVPPSHEVEKEGADELKVAAADPVRPYAIHSTLRLVRGLVVTEICQNRMIIQNAEDMLAFSYKFLGKAITNYLLRISFFVHFCGGETHDEVSGLVNRLNGRGIGAILDYAAEASETEVNTDQNIRQPENDEHYESNVGALRDSIIAAARSRGTGFSALKVTSLASTGFLRRVSTVLADPTSSVTYLSSSSEIASLLHPDDEAILRNVNRRLDTLFYEASAVGSRVMVDAEDTSIQPAIDFFTLRAIMKYNVHSPVIYQTYQMYLKKSIDRLEADKAHVTASGNYFAVKLVRGAYMEMERKNAALAGKESPVHDTLDDTNDSYNAGLREMLKAMDKSSLMVASHNANSAQLVTDALTTMGAQDTKEVFFSQLLGMKDHITLSLAEKGYKVHKYVPYGPIEEVIPYLLRRSQENSQMAQEDAHTRAAVIEELWGRFLGKRTQKALGEA